MIYPLSITDRHFDNSYRLESAIHNPSQKSTYWIIAEAPGKQVEYLAIKHKEVYYHTLQEEDEEYDKIENKNKNQSKVVKAEAKAEAKAEEYRKKQYDSQLVGAEFDRAQHSEPLGEYNAKRNANSKEQKKVKNKVNNKVSKETEENEETEENGENSDGEDPIEPFEELVYLPPTLRSKVHSELQFWRKHYPQMYLITPTTNQKLIDIPMNDLNHML